MKNSIKALVFLFSLLMFTCSSDDGNNNGGGGGATDTATYRITFTPTFTATTHPVDYPNNAGFASMMVVMHTAGTTVFRVGQNASDGLESYAEEGITSGLEAELMPLEGGNNPTIVRIGNNIDATGSDFIDITITPATTFLSFISRVSPSPDWFAGLDAISLLDGNQLLIDEMEILLSPFDAGTDTGVTYDSPDSDGNTSIIEIEGAPFLDPALNRVFPIGTLKIERTDNGIQ